MTVRTIRVTDFEQATAALEQARTDQVDVVLVSAKEVTAFAGVGYWRALERAVGRPIVIDCGDDAGLAMAALRAGSRELLFSGPAKLAVKLAGMADSIGAVLRQRMDDG